METKSKNPKPRNKGGSAAATRAMPPLSLNARLYGPVLAIKGTASPRFAPLGFLWSPGAFDLMHR